MPSLKILIADDQSDCRVSLARLLRVMGHEVWPVAGGDAVKRVAPIIRPDLILVDIGMPGVDGYEVARRLQSERRGASVVAVTGWATEEDKRQALAAGFDSHLSKPVDITTLESLLDQRLKTRSPAVC